MQRNRWDKRWCSAAPLLLGALALLPAAAHGTQHLVEPGKDWSTLVSKVRPGDEILLMPGTHSSVTLRGLRGTAEQPITIRGIDPDDPPRLRGPKPALTLINAEHVVLEHFVIVDCAATAVVIAREPDQPQPETESETNQPGSDAPVRSSRPDKRGPVVLRHFQVRRIGPDDAARAVVISNTSKVTLEQWSFESWSGQAVHVFHSSDIAIERCTFTGDDEFGPDLAIQVYGGSRDVMISQCRFTDAGRTTAVMLGGRTALREFDRIWPKSPSHAPVAEASQCDVVDSVFVNQPCPIVLAHADRCEVRFCTIVRPKRFVVAMLNTHGADGRFMAVNRPTLDSNLITWRGGELTGVLLVDQANRHTELVLRSNLWWSDEPAERRRTMIPTNARESWPQLVNVDPRLDEQHRPHSDEATMYGAQQ